MIDFWLLGALEDEIETSRIGVIFRAKRVPKSKCMFTFLV